MSTAASNSFSHSWVRSVLTGSSAPHSESTPFSRIWTDSRTVRPGDLFVALRGDSFDGHRFVTQAIQSGATGVVVDATFDCGSLDARCSVFQVKDTLAAFRTLGTKWRAQFDLPVVAVVGSVGKTTTKELIAAILSDRFGPVLKTDGSENGFIGIPKTLLRLQATHRAAVIEIGIDEIGAMIQHLEVVRPNAVILTAIGEEHLEKLIDLKTVLREERRALDWVLEKNGRAIFNLDDPHLLSVARSGDWKSADAYAVARHELPLRIATGNARGTEVTIRFDNGESIALNNPLEGAHNVSNLVGAATVAHVLGVGGESIQRGLAAFVPPSGRSNTLSHPLGMEFIFDYYNASPSSMKAAFELLHQKALVTSKRTRACLADMLELGTAEEALHRGLAASLIRHGIERVWLFGTRMRWLHDELTQREFSGELRYFETMDKMEEAFATSLPTEEAILIKGSRGMKMERLTARIPPGPEATKS